MENIEVKQVVTNDALENILCSAFDPASNGVRYWCEISGQTKPKDARAEYQHQYPLYGGALFLKDIEADAGETYVLDEERIKDGVQKMAFGSPILFARLVDNDTDKNDADIFIQYCLFGEIIYG